MTLRISLPMKLAQVVDAFSQEKYMALVAKILTRAGVAVDGRPLWISPHVHWDCPVPGSISVGDRCVISREVTLLTHDFSLDRVAELKLGETGRELVYRGPIEIGAYAFIGWGVIVLPGVTIGRGAVVGAGSVVTKDIPDGVVVGGRPARQLSTTDEYWQNSRDRFSWQSRRK